MDASQQQTTLALKKMRTTQAGNLTRQVNKGTKGMREDRSKRYLCECLDNIHHALSTLEETNNLYCLNLSTEQDYRTAQNWITERRDLAVQVGLDLERRI
jgi:hypothetical protein